VLADRSIRDALADKLATTITEFYGDDPQRSDSFGRIVNERHLDRLRSLLDGAGTIVAGGEVDATDRYVAPTITVDPSPESPILQEEIFGPILPVLAVDGPAAAVAHITARAKPLALYVFAGDDEVVDHVVDGTNSGGVCINHTLLHLVPPELPFGGVGDSGSGAYHGKAGFDAFSHRKSILRTRTRPDPKLLYPPYRKLVERIVARVVR
jgi:aldehyde dehydrogenase (NAD+)